MSNFIQGAFVNPVTPEDNTIQIKDRFGRIRYSIAPIQVTAVFVSGNLIKIKKKGTNDIILLDFRSNDEAKVALTELQIQIDAGRSNPPLKVDPALTAYIDSKVSFIYHQIYATTSWGVSHSLGYRPNITVTDEYFEEIEGLIKYISLNDSFTVEFNQSLTGWVFCS